MTLDEYMISKELTNLHVGDAIGITGEAVRQLRKSGRVPRKETITKIKAWSEGSVTLEDWYG